MSPLNQRPVKNLLAPWKPWGHFSRLHCSIQLTQHVCSPKEDNTTHQPEWFCGTWSCLLSLDAQWYCIRLSMRTVCEVVNAYSFASVISLTQLSLIETLFFPGKPLNRLLFLLFCFLVEKQIRKQCTWCKSVDVPCWSKHTVSYCTHPVSQSDEEKLQNTRSEGLQWASSLSPAQLALRS